MTEHAFWIEGADRPSPWLITCDHATNRVPDWVNGGDLGIAAADMARHIAYDVGAAGVASLLGQRIGAPVIFADFSRLVIDPNRGQDDPTLLMRIYDGTVIAGNRHADQAEKQRRLDRLWHPYHAAYERLAHNRAIGAIHSFTPNLRGHGRRPWEIGILHAPKDGRLAPELLRRSRAADWVTGDNQPYKGHLPGDSIDQHGLAKGRAHTLIEIRNDLITDAPGQQVWAENLAALLDGVLETAT